MYMYSIEHSNYLKKLKKNKRFIILMQIILILIFFTIWELLSRYNIINSFIYSSFTRVIKTIKDLAISNNLFNHIWVTLYETIISFIIGSLLGLIISSILWWNKTLYKILDPFLTIINSLPKVSLGPLIIIWAGANIKSIIIMALLISTINMILNTYQNFITVDQNKIKLLKSFNCNKYNMLIKLIIPSNYNNIISMLKINYSMTLIGVIMGELLVSKEGLGYLIMYGSQIFNLDLIISSIFILAIFSTITYYLILYIEKKLVKN